MENGFALWGKGEVMDKEYPCDYCHDIDCMNCDFGNPCLGCKDYDRERDRCKSNGGCGEGSEDGEMD